MKVIVIGRGCVGSTVAHNLYKSCSLFFLVGLDRALYSSRPIVFNGSTLCVETITPSSSFEADLIINCVKNFDAEDTIELMEPFVGEKTVIIPLQNGLESVDLFSSHFGKEKVLYSFISNLSCSRDGINITSFTPGLITIGERDNSKSERILKIAKFFNDSGMPVRIADDIHHSRWVKFMTNISFNSLTALFEITYGELRDNDNYLRLIRLIAQDVKAVAKMEGVTITQLDIENMIQSTLSLPPNGRSSMCDDIINGRRTENNYFAASLSRIAKRHDLSLPRIDFLYILLEAKSYESKRRS